MIDITDIGKYQRNQILKGLSAKISIGLKVAPFPTDQWVIGEKSDKSLKK